jgi:hypothetical protein
VNAHSDHLKPTYDQMEALLRFYADRRNHAGVGVSQVYRDGGRAARKLLGECEKCEGLGGWADNNARHGWQMCHDCHLSGVANQPVLVRA